MGNWRELLVHLGGSEKVFSVKEKALSDKDRTLLFRNLEKMKETNLGMIQDLKNLEGKEEAEYTITLSKHANTLMHYSPFLWEMWKKGNMSGKVFVEKFLKNWKG